MLLFNFRGFVCFIFSLIPDRRDTHGLQSWEYEIMHVFVLSHKKGVQLTPAVQHQGQKIRKLFGV